ncbi:MAG TPA: class I SAM-dependent methyltransferase [Thermoanaerobaculia bacterium]
MSDDRYVDAPPAGAAGWAEVWRENRRYRSGGGLQSLLQKIFRRGSATDLDRQRDFNLALIDLLNDVRAEIAKARDDARADVNALQADVQRGDEALAADVKSFRDLIPIASRRNDALVAALDQKIESVGARLRDITTPMLRTEDRGPRTEDFIYRRLEESFRGSEQQVRESLDAYLAFAREHQPLFDIGCGRGEFLALCREAGITARGFDTNERSIADLKQRGFDVALAGVPECFRGVADGSIGSILATHVVEHLPVEVLFELYRQASRVLRRGALLMIETPNAESLLVTGSDFWRDPTHLAPRHPAALVLLAREHGFDIEELRAVHPFPDAARLPIAANDSPDVRRLAEAINERFFGPQDLRLIVRKR